MCARPLRYSCMPCIVMYGACPALSCLIHIHMPLGVLGVTLGPWVTRCISHMPLGGLGVTLGPWVTRCISHMPLGGLGVTLGPWVTRCISHMPLGGLGVTLGPRVTRCISHMPLGGLGVTLGPWVTRYMCTCTHPDVILLTYFVPLLGTHCPPHLTSPELQP